MVADNPGKKLNQAIKLQRNGNSGGALILHKEHSKMRFFIENYKNYTIVPNIYIRDKYLSLTAKGLLTVMYSLPNDWDYTINGLCKITNSGITRIRNTILELEMFGYLERKQYKNEKGQFDYDYFVYRTPKKNIIKNYKKSISNKRKNRI